ncbi:hypothetical protein [Shewanella sp. 10N.286.54.B9]|uniref:hypothetical protein n=1 Tax=Shewanella sp. 10N.286.54.B9 TaxID=3229719 RepID=UPI00354BFC11
MKITRNVIVAVIIGFFLILLVPYLMTFNGGLSNDSNQWAHFGTYIGGTLGPIGAFLAFWGLIQQNSMYRRNAELERVVLKLDQLDSEIASLATHCLGYTTNPGQYERIKHDLTSLLLRYDPMSTKLIEEKRETLLGNKTGLQRPDDNYRAVSSISSKIVLIERYLHSIKTLGNEIEVARYNDKYHHLLKELKLKSWINFDKFE